MDKSVFIKRADLFLAVILILLFLILTLPNYLSNSSKTAVVYSNGNEIYRIELDAVKDRYEIELDCSPAVKLTVENGCIYYSYAECHDKLCINSGKLRKSGDTAACLPSKTLIVIEGNHTSENGNSGNGNPDVITY